MRGFFSAAILGACFFGGCALVFEGSVRNERDLVLDMTDQGAGRLYLTARCAGAPQTSVLVVECRVSYGKSLPTEGEHHLRTAAMRNLESMVRSQFSGEGAVLELIEMSWTARDFCPDTFKYLYRYHSTLDEI